jgi:GAF domain-containing protein
MSKHASSVLRFAPAPKPPNEAARLAALARLQILDTAPDSSFESLTHCAATALDCPVALITLVDDERQWFMSKFGLEMSETSRDVSFCAHAVYSAAPLVIPDARNDERFRHHPMVEGAPHIRGYLGMPMVLSGGLLVMGSFSVIDYEARAWSAKDIAMVRDLAHVAMRLIEINEEAHMIASAFSPGANEQTAIALSR